MADIHTLPLSASTGLPEPRAKRVRDWRPDSERIEIALSAFGEVMEIAALLQQEGGELGGGLLRALSIRLEDLGSVGLGG